MKDKKKIICFYLPQYYEFPENNEWWGKGFTEWINVRKARPLFKGHYQPTIPQDQNFYALDNVETMRWQVELAKEHHIYGFCFYHYWFGGGKLLMEKPVEMYLRETQLDLPFCLSWANHNWTRTWTGGDTDILMEVKYGGEKAIREHFEYLLPYFKDKRYIKMNNKPVFVIYMPELIPNLKEMKNLFQTWCREEGFSGIVFVSQAPIAAIDRERYRDTMDYAILYEPNYTQQSVTVKLRRKQVLQAFLESPSNMASVLWNAAKKRFNEYILRNKKESLRLTTFSYDGTWRAILKRKVTSREYWPGGFAGFDNSPRKKYNAIIYKNGNPKKFAEYMKKLVRKSNGEFLFLMAWNEWGEGAYLEPDERHQSAYLEAVRHAVDGRSEA